jgi:general secretion pathway protein D
MSAFGQTNSLIISDFGANIDRVMKIINQLDVPGFEDQLEVIGIKWAKAKDMADLIDKIVNKGQKSTSSVPGGFSAGVPRFGTTTNTATNGKQGAAYFLVFAEDRTNSLVVVGNKAGILRVKKLIAQLDFKPKAEDAGGVYVYYVKNGKAEDIAATLSDVAKDAGAKSTPTAPTGGFGIAPQGQAAAREGLFGGDVSIKADKNTNALVISASKQDYERVLTIINKLDIPRDQVFVSAIIMEMQLNDGFNASGGLVAFNKDGGKSGFTASQDDVSSVLSPLGGAGSAILSFAQGTMTVNDPTSPGKTLQLPNLVAYLKFLKSFGKTNILSTPQITATDSKKAEIEVGEDVVVGVKVTPGTNGSQALEEPNIQPATIHMTLTPFISPTSDNVRMEFKQQVKQLGQAGNVPPQFKDKALTLATRSIDTNVNVNNGDTAVIGGLIRDTQIENTVKVPLLGDLPIIGWLFKSKSSTKTKTNMLVFLTPRILRSRQDQLNLLNSKEQERLNFIKQQGGKDPYGAEMDKVMGRNRNPGNSEVK